MNNTSESNPQIERLIALGYSREDIQVLPDGTLTIIPADEMKGSAIAVAKATAPARLEKMMARKKKLDDEFKMNTSVPKQMNAEQLQEYFSILTEIERTQVLLR